MEDTDPDNVQGQRFLFQALTKICPPSARLETIRRKANTPMGAYLIQPSIAFDTSSIKNHQELPSVCNPIILQHLSWNQANSHIGCPRRSFFNEGIRQSLPGSKIKTMRKKMLFLVQPPLLDSESSMGNEIPDRNIGNVATSGTNGTLKTAIARFMLLQPGGHAIQTDTSLLTLGTNKRDLKINTMAPS
jgi:hypothetical protein